jgi:hypothetical protein
LITKIDRHVPSSSSHPPTTDCPGAVLGPEARLDDREARRRHERAADPLDDAGSDEGVDPRGRSAEQGPGGEPDHPNKEHPPPPEVVAERPGKKQQRSQAQRVAGDCPLELGEVGPEVAADERKRHVHHRRIDPGDPRA